jgi:hypothetical protein
MRVTRTKEARMRGDDRQQAAMWSYISPEQRVPPEHPLRQHARPDIGRRTGRISTNDASRLRHDGVRRAPELIRSGRGGTGLGWAGDGTPPEWERARCARIFRMTAGSWSVAIRRKRPPQLGHASTSMPNARCVRAARVQARGLVCSRAPSATGASAAVLPAALVGSGATRPLGDHATAPPGARGQPKLSRAGTSLSRKW